MAARLAVKKKLRIVGSWRSDSENYATGTPAAIPSPRTTILCQRLVTDRAPNERNGGANPAISHYRQRMLAPAQRNGVNLIKFHMD